MSTLRILTVCTMNICRSPVMAVQLRRELDAAPPTVSAEVTSAGTAAEPGLPRCAMAQALIGVDVPTGQAQLLSSSLINDADLIFTADSGHRGAVLRQLPQARSRTFTLLEAARLATWVVGPEGTLSFALAKASGEPVAAEPEDLRALTDALPADAAGRGRWLVAEMEAARGMAPRTANRFGYLRLAAVGSDDLPDPHVLGYGLHQEVVEAITLTSTAWVEAFERVLHA